MTSRTTCPNLLWFVVWNVMCVDRASTATVRTPRPADTETFSEPLLLKDFGHNGDSSPSPTAGDLSSAVHATTNANGPRG